VLGDIYKQQQRGIKSTIWEIGKKKLCFKRSSVVDLTLILTILELYPRTWRAQQLL